MQLTDKTGKPIGPTDIYERWKSGETYAQIAEHFGVTEAELRSVYDGRRCRNQLPITARRIRAMRRAGYSYALMAACFATVDAAWLQQHERWARFGLPI